MKHWKLLVSTALLGTMLSAPAYANTTIYYNDELLNTQQPIELVNNRTMLAMRDLFESLDTRVDWDDAQRMVSLSYRDKHILMFPDTGVVQVNGVPQALDVKPQIIHDRVYLPLRFVAQTLGGTVDYTQLTDGTNVVSIHTIDSVENYVQKEGKVTKILRETTTPVNTVTVNASNQATYDAWSGNHARYFFERKGNLVEVQSYDQTLMINTVDYKSAEVSAATINAPAELTALGNVTETETGNQIELNTFQNKRYLGIGQPITNQEYNVVRGMNERIYKLYDSNELKSFLDIANDRLSIVQNSLSGFTLDLADCNTFHTAASVQGSDKSQAFLLDEYLFIVDKNASLLQETELTKSIGHSKMLVSGDHYFVVYVDENLIYPELMIADYCDSKDSQINNVNASQMTKVTDGEVFYPYNYLKLLDAYVKGNTVYAFIKTDMDYYVIRYNCSTNKSEKELLKSGELPYTQLIDTPDGVKLLSVDEKYYYLRDID